MTDAPFDERAVVGLWLKVVVFDWQAGQLEVHLTQEPQASEVLTTLVADGVTLLRCPRQQRWTQSARVYELRRKGAGARHRLELELQSGDVLEVEADALSLHLAGDSSARR